MKTAPIVFCIFTAGSICAQEYVISTYAGGPLGSRPLPALDAAIGQPQALTADAHGNVYFTSLSSVFKLDSSRILTRIAGNTRGGYSGDGGPAVRAQFGFSDGEDFFFEATGLAVDGAGNIYISDTVNHRVRKVSADGVISTIAGNGTRGYSGDGGPAVDAQIAFPSGLAIDSANNLYVAMQSDTGEGLIRKISPDGTIHRVAEDLKLQGWAGLVMDASDNLYIADKANQRVLLFTASGSVRLIAGNGARGYSGDGGPAISAQLAEPYGLAWDSARNLYIADSWNGRVRKVTPDGIITTVAGGGAEDRDGGSAASANLFFPYGVAVDLAGNLLIGDTGHLRIRIVSQSGVIIAVAGNGSSLFAGDGKPAAEA